MSDKNSKNKNDPSNGDEDYGLPKVNLSPLSEIKDTQPAKKDPDPSVPGVKKEQPASKEPKKEDNDHTALILIIILFILLAGGYALYHYELIDFNGEGKEVTITSQNGSSTISPEPIPPSEPIEETRPPLEPEADEIKLTEITSRSDSPRYFVVVGSFIDGDLAKDYSDRLNENEKSTFLIHPYGDGHFYRLSVGHFENLDSAVNEMESLRSSFEENLWVLKY